MAIFEDSLEASMLSIGRNPGWTSPAFPKTDGVADPTLLPETAINGIALRNSPKCLVWFAPRELVHAHGARVRVTAVDDTDTYTVTLGGTNPLDHDYAATGGDEEAEIIDGLVSAINDGVDLTTLGGDTLEYTNANPDTLTRAGGGSWVTDGLQPGDRVTATHTATNANDGITFTVAEVTSATVLTLVEADIVTALAGSTVTNFVVQRPVTASRETRSGVETLVITYKRLENSEVDDPTNTFTVAVSAAGAGALEFDEDATGGAIQMFLVAGGAGLLPASTQWIAARNGEFTGIDYRGLVERVDCAGFSRIYPRATAITSPTTGATATYTLKLGPSILE